MSGPEIVVVPDAEAASAVAADRLAAALRSAALERDRADWATTGGSTPIGIYRHLAGPPHVDDIPWRKVHVWWGDDRYVPRDHALSNVKPLDDILLDTADRQAGSAVRDAHAPVPLAIENVHPFQTTESIGAGTGPDGCAAELEQDLRADGVEIVDGWPVFDLILLGIGSDGHVLSVFPGSEAFGSSAWALAIPAPTHIEPHVARVTLNPAVLAVARQILVVMHGAGKAAILGDIFGPVVDPTRWPAQLALRDGATWVLDEAAAANLPAR